MITLIAAIGRNNEIGLENKLLWYIPEDLKHFKAYTMGKVVVMGFNTFVSIGSKPLPGRRCVVISRKDMHGTAAIPAKSIEEAFSIEHCYDEMVVIGGASIYEQTMGRANKLVITHVDADFEADTYFPHIDMSVWKINNTTYSKNDNYNYRFVEYIRYENNRDIT
jgi:dihydrofolate reductase